jgi:D-threo-aldose 1-dehydrogenase
MDATKRVKLGKTGVEVTQLGIGTNPLGGLYEPIPSEVAQATFDACWQHGIRFYDVAPVYGYGFAEREAGQYLRGKPRDEYVLTTKVGRLLLAEGDPEREDRMVLWQGEQLYKGTDAVKPYFDFTYDGVMRSIEDSQRRTGIERFDALHIHDPDFYPEEALDGAFKALDQLRREGTIGAVGCGMNQWEMLAQFARRADFDCFLLAGRYTLLDQSALADLLPVCVERGISIINGGVYNSGILSHPDPASIHPVSSDASAIGSWTANVTFNYVPAEQAVIDKVARMKAVCDRHRVPLMAAAIQFSLHHPAVACVLMGPRNADQVRSNIEMFSVDIPADLWAELKHEGLVPQHVPTPA